MFQVKCCIFYATWRPYLTCIISCDLAFHRLHPLNQHGFQAWNRHRQEKKEKKNKTKLLVCYAINASLLLCFFPLHPPRFSSFCVCLKNRLVICYLQREFPLPHASSWAQKGHNYCPIFLNYNIVSHVCFTLFLILSNRLKNIYIFFKSITGCSAELTIL